MGQPENNAMEYFSSNGVDIDLGPVAAAVNTALSSGGERSVSELLLRAANAMPSTASDFDRGIAVGLAMAQLIPQIAQEDDLPEKIAASNRA